ncbi:hypothetical protein [Pelomonas cellulosilytica]|nr:hypothetical protein [Pelomonas sp. P8]
MFFVLRGGLEEHLNLLDGGLDVNEIADIKDIALCRYPGVELLHH